MDEIVLTRDQARLLLAGVAVAAGCVGVGTNRVTPDELALLVLIFAERVQPGDQEWLLALAQRVESVMPPGVWH